MPLGGGECTEGVLAVVTMFGLLDLRFDPNPRFLIREFIRSMSYLNLSQGFEGRSLAGLCGLSLPVFLCGSHVARGWMRRLRRCSFVERFLAARRSTVNQFVDWSLAGISVSPKVLLEDRDHL